MKQEVVLAMLAKEPSHGYELRARLRQALGPLGEAMNAGQIYVTLIAGGLALFAALGGGEDGVTDPPLWQLLAVAPVTVLVMAALTTIPARLGARRPAAEALQAEIV